MRSRLVYHNIRSKHSCIRPCKGHEAFGGPDSEPMKEDQTRSDSGKISVSLADKPWHMDDDSSPQPTQSPENLKLITDERVTRDKPESHSSSMSSMKNLDDTFNFGDQFLYDKPTEDDQEKSKVREESDSTIPDPSHQTVTSTPPVIAPFIDVSSSKPSLLVTPPPINTEATTLTTSLPEITPFIALQLRVARLEQEISEVKKTDHSADVLASIRSQVPTLSLIADEDAMDKELQTRVGQQREGDRILPLLETFETIPSDDISMQDEGNDSDMEDTDNAHIPKVSTTTWFKPIPEDERPDYTEQKDHSTMNFPGNQNILGNDTPERIKTNQKNETLRSDLKVLALTLLRFHKTTSFFNIRWMNAISCANKVDLSDKERKIALSISKLKAARYLDFGLEELVPSLWVESEREYDISAVFEKYGYNYLREIILRRADYQEYKISEKDFKNLHPNDFEDLFLLNIQEKLNHPKTDKTSLHTAVNMWIRNLVIRNRVGDLQLGIESYQTKINLERPNWDAADYYFKEDYTIVPKPRAVVYRDRNEQRKLMRLNELHKFSDGTLTRGMETRKWSEDDKKRSKDFITTIEKRLQIRRIYRSLESFVGGRIRDIDYRLINRTT
ncbi:hypothetical protein Tco_0659253 [Tanacetum coccineum]